ncbi:hypothetical protein [Streptomyces sp. NPDC059651]|uniref:hypothetical protein n=1 Tax=Streptomyces sp. NPDC059651 TaxID=3346897 RepID=UPI0036795ADF
MSESEANDNSPAARFSSFTKRNLIIVAVLFLSNVVTAVSTLVTAWTGVLDSRRDWRPDDYRKLRELHAGHTLDRFTEQLGIAAYRWPIEGTSLTKHAFRPRDDYWVEVVADQSGSTLAYTVTSCRPNFRPTFRIPQGKSENLTVTLNSTPLAHVNPDVYDLRFDMPTTASGEAFVLQYLPTVGDATDDRGYVWGLNDTCAWNATGGAPDVWTGWDAWYSKNRQADGAIEYLDVDRAGRTLMAQSLVNTYAESAPFQSLLGLYPRTVGVLRGHVESPTAPGYFTPTASPPG